MADAQLSSAMLVGQRDRGEGPLLVVLLASLLVEELWGCRLGRPMVAREQVSS